MKEISEKQKKAFIQGLKQEESLRKMEVLKRKLDIYLRKYSK